MLQLVLSAAEVAAPTYHVHHLPTVAMRIPLAMGRAGEASTPLAHRNLSSPSPQNRCVTTTLPHPTRPHAHLRHRCGAQITRSTTRPRDSPPPSQRRPLPAARPPSSTPPLSCHLPIFLSVQPPPTPRRAAPMARLFTSCYSTDPRTAKASTWYQQSKQSETRSTKKVRLLDAPHEAGDSKHAKRDACMLRIRTLTKSLQQKHRRKNMRNTWTKTNSGTYCNMARQRRDSIRGKVIGYLSGRDVRSVRACALRSGGSCQAGARRQVAVENEGGNRVGGLGGALDGSRRCESRPPFDGSAGIEGPRLPSIALDAKKR